MGGGRGKYSCRVSQTDDPVFGRRKVGERKNFKVGGHSVKTKGNNYLVAQTRDSGNYGVWDNGSSWKPSVDNFLAAFLSPLSSRLPTLSPLGTNTVDVGRCWKLV